MISYGLKLFLTLQPIQRSIHQFLRSTAQTFKILTLNQPPQTDNTRVKYHQDQSWSGIVNRLCINHHTPSLSIMHHPPWSLLTTISIPTSGWWIAWLISPPSCLIPWLIAINHQSPPSTIGINQRSPTSGAQGPAWVPKQSRRSPKYQASGRTDEFIRKWLILGRFTKGMADYWWLLMIIYGYWWFFMVVKGCWLACWLRNQLLAKKQAV